MYVMCDFNNCKVINIFLVKKNMRRMVLSELFLMRKEKYSNLWAVRRYYSYVKCE